ncbi:MAG: lipoyl(octanoyl) transferase LipB [Oligoflexia bacterium]|nr:lipoyl(octanoyl) transferase LipB [Oligoflexia bacterium]
MADQLIPNAAIAGIKVLRLGLRPYAEVWELQKQLQRELIAQQGAQTVIFCQHRPVITIGKSSKPASLLVARAQLEKLGIELFEVERGGDMTFHGPGQLVCYPILNLTNFRRDVGWYMRQLEEVAIRTLAHFQLKGIRVAERTGVWTDAQTKIASIGVRISRWCTMHGIALNVLEAGSGFAAINPCGFEDIRMTSMRELGVEVTLAQAEEHFLKHFEQVFRTDELSPG